MAVDVYHATPAQDYFSAAGVGDPVMVWLEYRIPLAKAARAAQLAFMDPKLRSEIDKRISESLERSELYTQQLSVAQNVSTRVAQNIETGAMGLMGDVVTAQGEVASKTMDVISKEKLQHEQELTDVVNSASIPAGEQIDVKKAAELAASVWTNNANRSFEDQVTVSVNEIASQARGLNATRNNNLHGGAIINDLVDRVKAEAHYSTMDKTKRVVFDNALAQMYGGIGMATQPTADGPIPTAVVRMRAEADDLYKLRHTPTTVRGVGVKIPKVTSADNLQAAPQKAPPAQTRSVNPSALPNGNESSPVEKKSSTTAPTSIDESTQRSTTEGTRDSSISDEDARAQGATPVSVAPNGTVLQWKLSTGPIIPSTAYFLQGQNPQVAGGLRLEDAERRRLLARRDDLDAAQAAYEASGASKVIGLPLWNPRPANRPASGRSLLAPRVRREPAPMTKKEIAARMERVRGFVASTIDDWGARRNDPVGSIPGDAATPASPAIAPATAPATSTSTPLNNKDLLDYASLRRGIVAAGISGTPGADKILASIVKKGADQLEDLDQNAKDTVFQSWPALFANSVTKELERRTKEFQDAADSDSLPASTAPAQSAKTQLGLSQYGANSKSPATEHFRLPGPERPPGTSRGRALLAEQTSTTSESPVGGLDRVRLPEEPKEETPKDRDKVITDGEPFDNTREKAKDALRAVWKSGHPEDDIEAQEAFVEASIAKIKAKKDKGNAVHK